MLVGVFFFCVTVVYKQAKKEELAVIQISTSGLVNTLYTKSVLNNFFFSKLPCSREEQRQKQKYTVSFKFVNYNLIRTNEQNGTKMP